MPEKKCNNQHSPTNGAGMFQTIKKTITTAIKVLTFVSKYVKYCSYFLTLSFVLRFISGIIMFFENLWKVLSSVWKVTFKVTSILFKGLTIIVSFLLKAYAASTAKVYNVVRKIEISSDDPNLKLTKRTTGSICFDIPISSSVVLLPKDITIVPTPFKIECLDGVYLKVYSRSGLAAKNKVALFNGTGIIDSDYRGYINLIFVNNSNEPYTLQSNTRVAQMMVCSKVSIDEHLISNNKSFEIINEDRGGGLGSTSVDVGEDKVAPISSSGGIKTILTKLIDKLQFSIT